METIPINSCITNKVTLLSPVLLSATVVTNLTKQVIMFSEVAIKVTKVSPIDLKET